MKHLLFLSFLTAFAHAQTPGVQAEWDFSKSVAALASGSARLVPLVDDLAPTEWVAKGASETYVAQWQSAREQLGYLASTAAKLERQPEKLSVALDVLFRLLAIETRVQSLVEGARVYSGPSAGDEILAVLGQTSTQRDLLQQYILDLAGQREQEFSIIDQEAQRCRTNLNRQPAPPPPAKRPAPRK